ncbi:MAG: alkaline phosphatase family protein [Caldilineales bacterium]|nr:alkaline phosphatase family protein [Caldilineales bacterium]
MFLVIGLDGADWRILDPWLDSGDLPNLAKLRQRGCWGNLRSTIRPESSTAWAAFATGVNSGVHGVFGFFAQQPHTYTTTINTASAIRSSSFWRHAAAMGKRVALLNVPMTYPPRPLPGGEIVAGMLSPSLHSEFTYPADLRTALLSAVPDYVINVERTGLGLRQFIRETTKSVRARGKAGLWLLGRQAWDAAVIVFTETDRLQHYTLHLLDANHPRHDPNEARQLLPDLLAAYVAIDDAVGDLLNTAGADVTVILLSDHGFAPCAHTFWPNVWLEQRGLLVRNQTDASQSVWWQGLRGHARLRRLKRQLPIVRDWRRPPSPDAPLAGIDWSRTSAVYSPTGGIRFNVRGREPEGVLTESEVNELGERLRQELVDWADEKSGIAPVLAVYKRGELYAGDQTNHAPDLIVEPYRAERDPDRNCAIRTGFAQGALTSSGDLTGNHTLDGIVLAAGPGLRQGDIADARLLDIAPTLLYALGAAIPAHMEGRVLELWQNMRPVERTAATDVQGFGASGGNIETEDEALVTERLRSLGYL